jgi:hypothetical protein
MLPNSFAVADADAESTDNLLSAFESAAEPEEAINTLEEMNIESTVTKIRTSRSAEPSSSRIL